MARFVFAQHGDDVFIQVEWTDGYGHHSRRVEYDELSQECQTHLDGCKEANPQIVRWQLDRHGEAVMVGTHLDGESSPVYDHKLAQSKKIEAAAAALMDWCDGYCAEWCVKNDLYEEERTIARIKDHVAERERVLDKKRSANG